MKLIVTKIKSLLLQGLSPHKLSYACVTGGLMGVFPLLGFSTTLGVIIATLFKLNHAVVQGINQMMTPIQILVIPLWIKAAEYLFHLPPVLVSPTQLIERFSQDQTKFFKDFGVLGLYCVILWVIFAIFIYLVLPRLLTKQLTKLARKSKQGAPS